ncbi:MAG: hypothetical protein ACLQBA_22745 [Candidatus Binataceae bacterium]
MQSAGRVHDELNFALLYMSWELAEAAEAAHNASVDRISKARAERRAKADARIPRVESALRQLNADATKPGIYKHVAPRTEVSERTTNRDLRKLKSRS